MCYFTNIVVASRRESVTSIGDRVTSLGKFVSSQRECYFNKRVCYFTKSLLINNTSRGEFVSEVTDTVREVPTL